MRYAVGFGLVVVGLVIGLLGDVPLKSPIYTSLEWIVAGGLLVSGGVATLLLTAAHRGSRDDEPEGHIRP